MSSGVGTGGATPELAVFRSTRYLWILLYLYSHDEVGPGELVQHLKDVGDDVSTLDKGGRNTIAQGLDRLRAKGYVVNKGYRRWALAPGVREAMNAEVRQILTRAMTGLQEKGLLNG